MAKESITTILEESTKVNGLTIKSMDLELCNMPMVTSIKVLGRMEKEIPKEYTSILTGTSTMECGLETKSKVLESSRWPLEIDIRENGLMERKMEMVRF